MAQATSIENPKPETAKVSIPVMATEQQANLPEDLDPQTVSTLKESLFDEVKFALNKSKDDLYVMLDYQKALIAQIRHELVATDGREITDDQILGVINEKLRSKNKQERRTWEEIGDRVIKQQIADLQAYAQAQIDYKPAPKEKFAPRKTKIAQTANTGQKVDQKMKTSSRWYMFGRDKGTAYGEVNINFGEKNGIFGRNYTNIARFNESTKLDDKTDRASRVRDRYGLTNGEIIPPQKMKMMEQVLINQVTALQDVSVRRHGGSISDENGFNFVKIDSNGNNNTLSQNSTEYKTIGTSRPKVNLQIEGLSGGERFPVDFSEKPEEQLKKLTEFLNKITLEKVAEIESGKHQKARIDEALTTAKNEANEDLNASKPNGYDEDVTKFLTWGVQDWENKSFDDIKAQIQGDGKWEPKNENANKDHFLEMQNFAKKLRQKQSATYREERISQTIDTFYPKNTQDTVKLLGRASYGLISKKEHPANIRFEAFRKANPNFPPAYLHIAYVLMGEDVFEPTLNGRALLQKVNKMITPQELYALLDASNAEKKNIFQLTENDKNGLLKILNEDKIASILIQIKQWAAYGYRHGSQEGYALNLAELNGLNIEFEAKFAEEAEKKLIEEAKTNVNLKDFVEKSPITTYSDLISLISQVFPEQKYLNDRALIQAYLPLISSDRAKKVVDAINEKIKSHSSNFDLQELVYDNISELQAFKTDVSNTLTLKSSKLVNFADEVNSVEIIGVIKEKLIQKIKDQKKLGIDLNEVEKNILSFIITTIFRRENIADYAKSYESAFLHIKSDSQLVYEIMNILMLEKADACRVVAQIKKIRNLKTITNNSQS